MKSTPYKASNGEVISLWDFVRYTHHDATTGCGIAGGDGVVVKHDGGYVIQCHSPYELNLIPLAAVCGRDSRYDLSVEILGRIAHDEGYDSSTYYRDIWKVESK